MRSSASLTSIRIKPSRCSPVTIRSNEMSWSSPEGASSKSISALAAASMTALAIACEENPLAGVSEKMRRPSVRMIRQPPEYVPIEIAAADARITQVGMPACESRCPETTSVSAMTPIVFCASCVPWPNAMVAAEAICAQRKPRFARTAFTVHKGWWGKTPIGINRFCKNSDPYFAAKIAANLPQDGPAQ